MSDGATQGAAMERQAQVEPVRTRRDADFYWALGVLVREWRTRFLKLTQEQMATDLGWEQSKLSRIESGEQRVMHREANALAQRLGMSLDEMSDRIRALSGVLYPGSKMAEV